MKNYVRYGWCLAVFVGLLMVHVNGQETEFVPGQMYVKLTNRLTVDLPAVNNESLATQDLPDIFSEFYQIAQRHSFQTVRKAFKTRDLNLDHTYKIEFDPRISTREIQQALEGLSYVEYCEPIPIHKRFFEPNDWSEFEDLWHLEKINAQLAWDITKGSEDVVIAIVDDAVFIEHEDLAGNIWTNSLEIPNNGEDDDGNGFIDDSRGYNVAGDNPNPNPPDANGFAHGTHVAGCAAAATDNEIGIPAIGFNCKIMPIRASSNASIGGSGITNGYEGVDYAIAAGADIINMSWGGSFRSNVNQSLLDAAHRRGIILVAAAGNDNSEDLQYPAAYNNVIAVGSTNRNDVKAGSSSFGGWVDIMAPGDRILSTVPSGEVGRYELNSGTSMASPVVAGLLGLMISVNPCLSPDEVERILETTAVNIDDLNPNFVGKLGSGRIDAFAAVEAAFNAEGSGAPPPPTASFTFDNSAICSNNIPFSFTASDEGGGSCAFSISYRWTISGPNGFELVKTEQNPFFEFPESGSYQVNLEVSNSGGRDIEEQTIDVTINPKAFIDAGEDIILCLGDTLSILGSTSADIVSVQWEPTVGISDPNSLTPKFEALRGGDTYFLRVEGEDGCTLVDSISIDVLRNPFVRVSPAEDTLIQQGDTIQLSVLDGSGAFIFEWSPPEGLSDPTIANPRAYPDTTTTYSVLGIGDAGCSSSESITIVVGEPVSNSPLLPDGGVIQDPFPNPMNNSLTLRADLTESGSLSIELFDLLGKKKSQLFKKAVTPGSFVFQWERPANIPNGVYLLKWNWGDYSYVQRIQLQ
ncbi:MAG: S8 family serine peptidase [Bacteroidota bacterium]